VGKPGNGVKRGKEKKGGTTPRLTGRDSINVGERPWVDESVFQGGGRELPGGEGERRKWYGRNYGVAKKQYTPHQLEERGDESKRLEKKRKTQGPPFAPGEMDPMWSGKEKSSKRSQECEEKESHWNSQLPTGVRDVGRERKLVDLEHQARFDVEKEDIHSGCKGGRAGEGKSLPKRACQKGLPLIS